MGNITDLSEWQGTVDFAKLAKQVDMVILRVQAGSSHADLKYAEYAVGCKAHGIPFGTYAYAKFVSVSDAVQEAKDAYSRMDKASLFFVLDVETVSTKNPGELVPAAQAFVNYLKNQGIQRVGLYSGENFFNQQGLNRVAADFLWLAKYPSGDNGTVNQSAKPVLKCDLWQYSEKGKLDGISTNIDLNLLVGSKTLDWFKGIVPQAPQPVATIQSVTTAPSGWKKENGVWHYYENGQLKKAAWIKYKNNWYYLKDNGDMAQGWIQYKNNWYYLNPAPDRGEMITGWIHDGGKTYYCNPVPDRGEMFTGVHVIDGKSYSFKINGEMM